MSQKSKAVGADIKGDARGQFAKSQADAFNNGMVSAEPRVLSKEGQAPTADQQDAHGRDPDDKQSVKRGKAPIPAKLDVNDGDVTI